MFKLDCWSRLKADLIAICCLSLSCFKIESTAAIVLA